MASMDKENSVAREEVNNIRLMALVSQMFVMLYLCSTWTKCEANLTRETVLDIASTKYHKSWEVQLQHCAKEEDVHLIARTLGLNYRKILPNNYYLLSDENNHDELLDEPNSDITEALKLFPKVIWVEQQTVEDNDVRDIYSDPLWRKQEYLKSTAVGYGISHYVEDVWKKGYTGKGITVAVIDDGVRGTHQDFENRYDSTISTDIAKGFSGTRARHGTKCAGVIAAGANNTWCGLGVAFDSKIAGIRLFNNLSSTDAQEAQAFYNESVIKKVDIFSNSWGPKDNGFSIRAPGKFAAKALELGTTMGRNGLGSVYLFSAGNGGQFGDSCAFDGYVNSIYTIAVASVARDGTVPVFSEPCAAIMTAVYSVKDIVTLSSKNDTECVSDFGRTSAASAFVSGILALALQANRNLTWRDVQHLIARSSTWKGVNNDVNRVTNGKKFTVGKYFGFGILDALTLINKAKKWKNSVPEQVKCTLDITSLYGESQSIPKQLKVNVNHSNLNCASKMESLEHVQIRVDLNYSNRALLSVDVQSPSGTNSKFIYPRTWDAITRRTSYSNLVVTSVHFWGEPVVGEWTVKVKEDEESNIQRHGTLFNLTFIFYGISEVIADNDDEDEPGHTQTTSTTTRSSSSVGVTTEDEPGHTQTTSTTTHSSSSVGVTTEDSQHSRKPVKPWLVIVIVIGCLIVVGVPSVYFLWRHSTKPVRCSSPHEQKLEGFREGRTAPPDTRHVDSIMV